MMENALPLLHKALRCIFQWQTLVSRYLCIGEVATDVLEADPNLNILMIDHPLPLLHCADHCTLPPYQVPGLLVGFDKGGRGGWRPDGKGG